MEIKIDAHVHTEKSFDSNTGTAELIAACRARGLDGFACCDHDISYTAVNDGGIFVIPGIEISTDRGHLLGLFIDKEVIPCKDFFEAAKRVRVAGGITVLAHPFERRGTDKDRVLKEFSEIADYIDGIEVFNSRAAIYNSDANENARLLAERYGKMQFGGSDAHFASELGGSYTVLETEEKSFEALKKAVLCRSVHAAFERKTPRTGFIKSQFIRHKKGGFKFKSTVKYILFSCRCILLDIRDIFSRK